MAIAEHLETLQGGTDVWNAWRLAQPSIQPDLSQADLSGRQFGFRLNLSKARLTGTNFSGCDLAGANLTDADLQGARVDDASLRKATLSRANARRASFRGVRFHRAMLDHADLREADLTGSRLDVSSCHQTLFHGALMASVTYQTHAYAALEVDTDLLELAQAEGLDALDPASGDFTSRLTLDAFEYAHSLKSRWTSEFIDASGERWKEILDGLPHDPAVVQRLLDRFTMLNRIFQQPKGDHGFVTALNQVNDRLIQYLARHPEDLRKLHWRTFEELIADVLAGFGWKVELTQATKDGGYDILGVTRDLAGVESTWIVECKRWDNMVGVDIARALYTVKNDLHVGGALLATTSHFTAGVKDFKASRYDFELRDFNAIVDWLHAHAKRKAGLPDADSA